MLTPKLIAVSVNSSRGSIVQANIISDLFKNTAGKLNCSFYTFAEDLAVGPGYYILSSGHQAYADVHSVIGGISLSYQQLGLINFAKEFNLEPINIQAGKNKIRLNPFEKVKPEDEKWVKNLLNSRLELVKSHVTSHRKSLEMNDKDILNGEVYGTKRAIEIGLIDGVKELSSFVEQEFTGTKIVEHIITNQNNWGNKASLQSVIEDANKRYLTQEELLNLMNQLSDYGLTNRMEATINN